MVKPRRGSGARSIHLAANPSQARFFIDYVARADDGPARDGRPRAVDRLPRRPRRALPERDPAHDARVARRRVDQGPGDPRRGADRARRGASMEALGGVRAGDDPGLSRPRRSGSGSPTSTRASAAPSRRPSYAALPGRSYPELIVAMAAGESVAPHVGEFRAGMTFTRYYWQLELDEQLRPDGPRDRPGGPPRRAEGAPGLESALWPRCSPTRRCRPPRSSSRADALAEAPAPGARAASRGGPSCANCGAPMAPGQDWCLQCGAGRPEASADAELALGRDRPRRHGRARARRGRGRRTPR